MTHICMQVWHDDIVILIHGDNLILRIKSRGKIFPLFFQDKHHYELVIRAESAPLRTDTEIRVELEDVNDNEPKVDDFRIVYNVVADEPLPSVLGVVPATDADPTAMLRYNFSYGNAAGLLVLGDDGEIRLSPHIDATLNVNIRATFGIVVSDGRNEVRARLSLQLNHITHAMLASSVSLRLANVTGDTFFDPFLSFLEEALTVVVPCSADDITVSHATIIWSSNHNTYI